jgi:SAM-dependent methyltransferase
MDASWAYYEHNADRYAARTRSRVDPAGLTELVRGLGPGARVLDAGCGAGGSLRWLAERGFTATGIEASGKLAAHARLFSGCPVDAVDLRLARQERAGLEQTIRLPRFSGREASRRAATIAAPEEIPTGMPSSWITRRAMSSDSWLVTCSTESTSERSRFLGTKPAPMP